MYKEYCCQNCSFMRGCAVRMHTMKRKLAWFKTTYTYVFNITSSQRRSLISASIHYSCCTPFHHRCFRSCMRQRREDKHEMRPYTYKCMVCYTPSQSTCLISIQPAFFSSLLRACVNMHSDGEMEYSSSGVWMPR